MIIRHMKWWCAVGDETGSGGSLSFSRSYRLCMISRLRRS